MGKLSVTASKIDEYLKTFDNLSFEQLKLIFPDKTEEALGYAVNQLSIENRIARYETYIRSADREMYERGFNREVNDALWVILSFIESRLEFDMVTKARYPATFCFMKGDHVYYTLSIDSKFYANRITLLNEFFETSRSKKEDDGDVIRVFAIVPNQEVADSIPEIENMSVKKVRLVYPNGVETSQPDVEIL